MADEPSIPQISDAEWLVMREFWRLGKATSAQVIERLEPQTDWKPKTIQTMIGRLVQKGALDFEKSGREYLYWPAVTEKACEQATSECFLDHFFDGKVAPFLAAFTERRKLSSKDLDELKQLLDSMEEPPDQDDA